MSSFGRSKYGGLSITGLGSFFNLGRNSWPHLRLQGLYGYRYSVGGGLCFGWVIGMFGERFMSWIQSGVNEDEE